MQKGKSQVKGKGLDNGAASTKGSGGVMLACCHMSIQYSIHISYDSSPYDNASTIKTINTQPLLWLNLFVMDIPTAFLC